VAEYLLRILNTGQQPGIIKQAALIRYSETTSVNFILVSFVDGIRNDIDY
jgi:hypothetical protein